MAERTKKIPPRLRAPTEMSEQRSLMEWARYMGLPLVHHCNEGKRTPLNGLNLRKAGLSPGYPDLSLSQARGGYFGLYIELKQKRAYTPSEMKTSSWRSQRDWLVNLANEHYYAIMCFGWEHAKKIIELYLSWPKTDFVPMAAPVDINI